MRPSLGTLHRTYRIMWAASAGVVCLALLLWVFGKTPSNEAYEQSTVVFALFLLLADRLVPR